MSKRRPASSRSRSPPSKIQRLSKATAAPSTDASLHPSDSVSSSGARSRPSSTKHSDTRNSIVKSVADVFQEVADLRAQVERLKDENCELKLKALDFEGRLVKKDSECRGLRREMEHQPDVDHSKERRSSSGSLGFTVDADIDSDYPLECDRETEHSKNDSEFEATTPNTRSKNAGKAKKCSSSPVEATPKDDDIKFAGKYYIRMVDLSFDNLWQDTIECQPSDESLSGTRPQTSQEHGSEGTSYSRFAKEYPEIDTQLLQCRDDEAKFSRIAKGLESGGREARRRDSYTLKSKILEVALKNPQVPPRERIMKLNPPLSKEDKESRGPRHPDIATLLAPSEFIPKLRHGTDEEKMSIITRIANGGIKLTCDKFPSFLYDVSQFSSTSLIPGLLRGFILMRAWKCLYIGPSAGLLDDPAIYPKGGFAQTHEVTTVTIEQIAYVAMQVYFSLSTDDKWPETPRTFDLYGFYRNIIRVYNKAPQQWREDLISFWNQEVLVRVQLPPRSAPSSPESDTSAATSDMTRLFEEFESA
ncbi:hypothetical protein AAF712_005598 [Marasmius tenuissimus]|uniref:Uncharacterized protein n=1 Tax=Marasmius tenuissimus TaxID=585030 RepID=A0ABR3A1J0_9AGAR